MTRTQSVEQRRNGIIRTSVKSMSWRVRSATRGFRRLPDFIIIGGQRCGTTSLYSALARHPGLLPSFRKEVHYFDLHRRYHDLGWYRANFPIKARKAEVPTFEATPNYFAYPGAPEAIRETVPHAKLIALLRDPIERAHSSWRHERSHGWETRSFEDAVRGETTRIAPNPDGRPNAMRGAYLEKGRYAEHLERWLAVFDPSQMLILRSEDLFSMPGPTLSEILSFVGAEPDSAVTLGRINVAPPAAIDPELRLWLAEYFDPHNRRLTELIGPKFSWA